MPHPDLPRRRPETNGHEDIVKFLVDEDTISIDIPNVNGWTPLFFAIKNSRWDIVNM